MAYNPLYRGDTNTAASRTARSTSSGYQNGSGGLLAQCTPVATNSFGQLIAVDVSVEATVMSMIGVTGEDIPNSTSGSVYDSGRVENVSLPGFSIGDAIYVSKAGFLTNIKPSEGVGGFVAGDFVIFVGVIVKNEFNPLQKDLKLLIDAKIGQL